MPYVNLDYWVFGYAQGDDPAVLPVPPETPPPPGRLFDGVNRGAAAATAVRTATFVYIDIPGDPLYVNTSALDVVAGGHTWIGAGTLAGVESVSEDTAIIGAPVRLSLSGIPSALLTEVQTADYRNRAVEISLGFFDQDWVLLAGLEPLWSGVADYAQMTVSDSSSIISLTCENELSALIGRPIPIRYTDQEQRRRFAGDRFFEMLPLMFDRQIYWGGTRVPMGGGAGSQRGEPNRVHPR